MKQQAGFQGLDEDPESASKLWMHALAIGYAPAYLTENADGIRQDWPRIPLPGSKERLLASATLGRQIAALLDTETPVPGLTAGWGEAISRSLSRSLSSAIHAPHWVIPSPDPWERGP